MKLHHNQRKDRFKKKKKKISSLWKSVALSTIVFISEHRRESKIYCCYFSMI